MGQVTEIKVLHLPGLSLYAPGELSKINILDKSEDTTLRSFVNPNISILQCYEKKEYICTSNKR